MLSSKLLRQRRSVQSRGGELPASRGREDGLQLPFHGDHAVGARSAVNAVLHEQAVQPRPFSREEASAQKWYRKAHTHYVEQDHASMHKVIFGFRGD